MRKRRDWGIVDSSVFGHWISIQKQRIAKGARGDVLTVTASAVRLLEAQTLELLKQTILRGKSGERLTSTGGDGSYLGVSPSSGPGTVRSVTVLSGVVGFGIVKDAVVVHRPPSPRRARLGLGGHDDEVCGISGKLMRFCSGQESDDVTAGLRALSGPDGSTGLGENWGSSRESSEASFLSAGAKLTRVLESLRAHTGVASNGSRV